MDQIVLTSSSRLRRTRPEDARCQAGDCVLVKDVLVQIAPVLLSRLLRSGAGGVQLIPVVQ